MFTYVKLQNFKSFSGVLIDLERKKDTPKNLAIIYGANGSGKSTLVQAFMTLHKTLGTMRIKDMLMDLIENKIVPPDDIPFKPEKMIELLKRQLSSNTVENIIHEAKMIDSDESMVLEFGFTINDNSGMYIMEYNDSELIHERLEYRIKKNRGCCFDIDIDKVDINSNIFNTEEYLNDIKKQVDMYWGKHTLLSILQNELEEKSGTFVNSNMSQNIIDVLDEFENISCKIKGNRDRGDSVISVDDELLWSLDNGSIDSTNVAKLNEAEAVINDIFTALFDDVRRAFYDRKEQNGKIRYRLFLNKQIDEHLFDIDFKFESSGTQEILDLFPYLMLAVAGKTVIIDEFGNGIHDMLASRIINEIAEDIKGQLILTTHNTMLMDKDNDKVLPESLYFIMNNKSYNKSIKCVTEIEERLHPNYNYRNRYLGRKEYADALPSNHSSVDFSKLASLYRR